MSTATATTVKVSRIIDADREAVFAAWTEPAQLREWSCPEGATIGDATVDLRVGGAYRLCIEGSDGGSYTALGTYREIDPPRRLVYTWDWENPEQAVGETTVTVEFLDRDGRTEVILTHDGLPSAEAAAGHREGWTSCLAQLEAFLGR